MKMTLCRPSFAFTLALACPLAFAGGLTATVFDKEGKPLQHAVIYAVPATGSVPPAPAEKTQVIDQKGWEFTPYVTAVRVGTKVVFPNLDKTTHHVKSFSTAKEFEFFLSAEKASSPVIALDKPGAVIVHCMLHDWMRAYVYVLDTPWFAKTGEAGTAALDNLPEGSYRIYAWHPDLGQVLQPMTQNVTVGRTGATPVKFDFPFKPRKPRMPKTLPQTNEPVNYGG